MRNVLLALCVLVGGCTQRPAPPAFLDQGQVFITAHSHWEHFPIYVRIPVDVPPHYRALLDQCILTWNTVTNREVFVLGPRGPLDLEFHAPPGTVVVLFSNLPLHVGGVTWNETDVFTGIVDNSLVVFNSVQFNDWDFCKTVVHEFGHVLGLEHDEDTHSIMYPLIQSQQDQIEPRDIDYVNFEYDRVH